MQAPIQEKAMFFPKVVFPHVSCMLTLMSWLKNRTMLHTCLATILCILILVFKSGLYNKLPFDLFDGVFHVAVIGPFPGN